MSLQPARATSLPRGIAKDLRKLVRKAQERGWIVTMLASTRLRFQPPGARGHPVFCSGLNICATALRNVEAALRRQGLR